MSKELTKQHGLELSIANLSRSITKELVQIGDDIENNVIDAYEDDDILAIEERLAKKLKAFFDSWWGPAHGVFENRYVKRRGKIWASQRKQPKSVG